MPTSSYYFSCGGMRIRIGETWHEPTVEAPIVIEVTPLDRENMRNMDPVAQRLAYFAADDTRTPEEMHAWVRLDA